MTPIARAGAIEGEAVALAAKTRRCQGFPDAMFNRVVALVEAGNLDGIEDEIAEWMAGLPVR